MIKENKKNKLVTFLCACLMVCASALGLVQAVGTTLAISPSEPTINASNFTNYSLYNTYDYALNTYDVTGHSVIFKCIPIQNLTISTYNVVNSFNLYFYNDGVVSNVSSNVNSSMMMGSNSNTVQSIEISCSADFAFKLYHQRYMIFVANTSNGSYIFISDYMNGIRIGYNSADTSGAYNNGYNDGYNTGYSEGQTAGYNTGYSEGQTNGYNTGYSEGQTNGYNSGVTQGQNNVINNPNDYNLYTEEQYEQHYTDGYNSGITQGQNNVINNPNAYGLYTQAQYEQHYTDGYNAGVTQGQNNVINNPNDFGLNTNQQLEDSYNQGFVDGEQSSEAYQNGYDTGYTDGSNEVLNNPNSYGLYTLAQYEQNYQDGYIAGVENSQYGILSNVVISGFVLLDDVSTNISNSDFNFNAGTITPNSSLLNKLNSIFNSNTEDTAFSQIKFTLNEQYIYSRDNIINFVNLSLLPNQTSYLPVTYSISSTQTVALIYSFNPIVENNVFTGFNVGIIGDDTPLLNNTIESFIITYAQSSYDGIILTRENLVKPQALSIFANNVSFNNGYNVGYIDGSRSDVVNNAYDRGVVDGFNSGYSEGLANQNNATFASMISAVIDVPINAMRNLFNFDLLGINLFGFFTALFTLLVVITIIRLILGGK